MRELIPALSELQASLNRQYRIKVLLYDVALPGSPNTLSQVVAGDVVETLDITDLVRDLQITAQSISFIIEDPSGQFDPEQGSNRHLMRENQVIRILEGDAGVPEEDWAFVFTGHIRGQVGFLLSRSNRFKQVRVQALDRMSTKAYNRMPVTTRNYSEGDDLGEIAYDIARNLMCLTDDEIGFDHKWGYATCHRFLQIVELPAMEALRKVGEVIGYVPYFDGQGRLNFYQKYANPAEGFDIQGKLDIPYSHIKQVEISAAGPRDVINKVRVIGLDCRMSMIVGEYQNLFSGTVTTGYFESGAVLPVRFSEDDSARAITGPASFGIPDWFRETGIINFILDLFFGAEGMLTAIFENLDEACKFTGGEQWLKAGVGFTLPSFYVVKSAFTDVVIPFGTSEEYIPEGMHGGKIVVKNKSWQIGLAMSIVSRLIAAAAKPDMAPQAPAGILPTIPEGRMMLFSIGVFLSDLITLMSIGSGSYEIWGMPFDHVYREIEFTAVAAGVEFWNENELEIDNDIVDSCSSAEALAIRELMYQQQLSSPRNISMVHNLHIEQGDIIRLSDGRIYTVLNWNYNINRALEASSVPIVNYSCIKSSIQEPELHSLAMTSDGYIAALVDTSWDGKCVVMAESYIQWDGKCMVVSESDIPWYGKCTVVFESDEEFGAQAYVEV